MCVSWYKEKFHFVNMHLLLMWSGLILSLEDKKSPKDLRPKRNLIIFSVKKCIDLSFGYD